MKREQSHVTWLKDLTHQGRVLSVEENKSARGWPTRYQEKT